MKFPRLLQIMPLFIAVLALVAFAYTSKVELVFDRDYIKICPDCERYIACYSHSMYPTFGCKDTLLAVIPESRKDIGIGDIIGFRAPLDQFSLTDDEEKNITHIVHRVVGKDYRGCYKTKGDYNENVDVFKPCYYDIIYVVKAIVKHDVEVRGRKW